jgi:hypothetical protein
MSHVVQLDTVITDLGALDETCEQDCECELRRGQKHYKWWGHSVGDYPIPENVKEEDLGKCDHAIHVKGNDEAYEVGVVDQGDGTYRLIWDFYGGGQGLQEKIGAGASKLLQGYAKRVAVKAARAKGFKLIEEKTTAQGQVKLHLRG